MKQKVVLTDGREVGHLIFFRAFSVKGERYSIFLDIDNVPKGQNYQPFVLKDEHDGLFSVPDNDLMYRIINFLNDTLQGDGHYYTQSDMDLDLTLL
jgi:hypothetical protein